MKKNGAFLKVLIIVGALFFGVIAWVIIKSTATVVAVVPAQQIGAGTTITGDMLKRINVPVNTPKGYITDESSVIGQKINTPVGVDQLLYVTNFMTSFNDYMEGRDVPADYIITAIQIPSERAVGGLITPGDYVDILAIPNNSIINKMEGNPLWMKEQLGPITDNSYGMPNGINLYWVLSNVLILETNSDLASSEDSSISVVVNNNSSSNGGSFYVVALSYSDYQKLRLVEQYCNLWMNISPEQNKINGPMIDEMTNSWITALQDAQEQSKFDENGDRIAPQASRELKEQAIKDYIKKLDEDYVEEETNNTEPTSNKTPVETAEIEPETQPVEGETETESKENN